MPIPRLPPSRGSDSASNYDTPKTSPRSNAGAVSFMQELNKVNDQQAAIGLKLIKEKKRRQLIDSEIEVRSIQWLNDTRFSKHITSCIS